jgi:hypothetical protein
MIDVHINKSLDPANAETMAEYYRSASVGDFQATLSTLSDDVFFDISGDRRFLPFAGRWEGKAEVQKLFQAFASSFALLNLTELQVTQSTSKVYSFNDETFYVHSTSRFYRVPVLHVMSFNADNKICSLINTHDTTAAVQAFTWGDPIAVPISYDTNQNCDQPIPGLDDNDSVVDIAIDILSLIFHGDLPEKVKADNMVIYIPGLPTRDCISGVWSASELSERFQQAVHEKKTRLGECRGRPSIHEVVLNGQLMSISGIGGYGTHQPWTILAKLSETGIPKSASLLIDFQSPVAPPV